METVIIKYDKHNTALQQLMQLFVTLGGQIVSHDEESEVDYVAMIKKSIEEIKEGKGKAIKTEDLWN